MRVFQFLIPISVLLLSLRGAAESAWAVFKVSYKVSDTSVIPKSNIEAVGGVAGSAFFVTGGRGISAYHVLNPSLFIPVPGFQKVKVWLIHENESPITLSQSMLKFDPQRDLTEIQGLENLVPKRFHFKMESLTGSASPQLNAQAHFKSQGFRSGSAGPQLRWDRGEIQLEKVIRLDRLNVEGGLLRKSAVTIDAEDVKLKLAPGIQVDYLAVVGMSGGPLLWGGKVIGFNSFRDPESGKTWAIHF